MRIDSHPPAQARSASGLNIRFDASFDPGLETVTLSRPTSVAAGAAELSAFADAPAAVRQPMAAPAPAVRR